MPGSIEVGPYRLMHARLVNDQNALGRGGLRRGGLARVRLRPSSLAEARARQKAGNSKC
jgi:hypothetical protein